MKVLEFFKYLFQAIIQGFGFGEKVQDRKKQEYPLKEAEHAEEKPKRLIEVEVAKIDETKVLIRKYKQLVRKGEKLNIDLEKLTSLPVIDLDYLNHLEKELEVEEEEFSKELPKDTKDKVKKTFKERRAERKAKRNAP